MQQKENIYNASKAKVENEQEGIVIKVKKMF